MVFNDTTNNQGIIQSCESYIYGTEQYGSISGNTNRLQTFTRLSNRALERIETKIFSSDTRWRYDDNNFTTHGIATAELVAGQQDYELSVSHLKIQRLEVKDANGNYQKLIPIDQRDVPGALDAFQGTDGLPRYYDKVGESVFLYPAPASDDVTAAQGLKVHYQREPDYFSTADTTKAPGFASIFHELVPLWASYDFAVMNEMANKAQFLLQKITDLETTLENYYNTRDQDDLPVMSFVRGNFT